MRRCGCHGEGGRRRACRRGRSRMPESAPRDLVGAARLCCFHPFPSPTLRLALFFPCFSSLLPFFRSLCLSYLISLSFFHVLFFLSSCLYVLSFFPFLCSFPFCFLFSFFLFFFLKKQDAFCLDSVTGHSPIGIIVVRSVVSDSFCSPRAAARQAPLSMGFSRQEGWTGLPCPPAGGLPRGRQTLYSLSLQGSLDVP